VLVCLPDLLLRVIEVPRCSSVAKLTDQYLTHPATTAVRGEIVVTIITNIDVSGVSEPLKNPSSPISRQSWWGVKFPFDSRKQIGPQRSDIFDRILVKTTISKSRLDVRG
jgi:hypothetical protein